MLTTNAIKILREGCAESWGITLSNLLASTLEVMDGFAGKAPSHNAQNNSKTNALNSIPFASDLTFRVDSELSGEQAYV